jgi:transcription antitermination factor NusG
VIDHRPCMGTLSLSWHVAQFFYGHEHAAARAVGGWLFNQVTQSWELTSPDVPRAFCPVMYRRWVTRGAKHEQLVPVLSGYVFLEMELGDPHRWHEVAAQRGFHGFIGGEVPQPCRSSVIEALMARSTDEWVLEELQAAPTAKLDRGTIVRIATGHLENCLGVVEWTRDRRDGPVAQVKINKFFGIDIRAEVPLECLERVGKQEAAKVKSLLDLPVLRAV